MCFVEMPAQLAAELTAHLQVVCFITSATVSTKNDVYVESSLSSYSLS